MQKARTPRERMLRADELANVARNVLAEAQPALQTRRLPEDGAQPEAFLPLSSLCASRR